MGKKIEAIDPAEWRELPDKNRTDLITKLFIMRCTNEKLFVNGKISGAYCRIRNFFKSRPNEEINVIYDYIYTLDGKKIIPFADVYKVAEIHRKKLIYEAEQSKRQQMRDNGKIQDYAEITIDDILNM